ncbi:DHHC palmitoyltransferase-domain-containing protein [Russula dissimulans]|nr:DHHC palmitoyltransferase-domain-containing protein [Russula dissimulans]
MPPGPARQRNAHSLSSMVETARARRASRKGPKPWLVLKLSIAFAAAIIAYAGYVYIGRLCIPMIRRQPNSLGSRTLGIVFLAVFVVLGMMMIWAYIKVVFTPPGYAIKHLPRQMPLDTSGEEMVSRENSRPYHDIPPSSLPPSQIPRLSAPAMTHQASQGNTSTRSIPPSSSSLTSHSNPSYRPTRTGQQSRGSTTLHSNSHFTHHSRSQSRSAQPSTENGGHTDRYTTFPRPLSERQRSSNGPQSQPQSPTHILPTRAITPQPRRRYCDICEIVKSPRTHHCKTCGKCVLRFDHHCPWIGQCVGAQNEKFFFVFVLWGAVFCLWTFSSLLALTVRSITRTDITTDPQCIVMIVISGIFSMFTVVMSLTHVVLIGTNQTTLEHVAARAMNDQENDVLDEMHSFWACKARRRTRQAWDIEYGRIGREGNMWWLGSMRANWEQVFGPHVWTWFLPIGSTKDKGLEFPRNPRFNADGVWLPRKQWPPELR